MKRFMVFLFCQGGWGGFSDFFGSYDTGAAARDHLEQVRKESEGLRSYDDSLTTEQSKLLNATTIEVVDITRDEQHVVFELKWDEADPHKVEVAYRALLELDKCDAS